MPVEIATLKHYILTMCQIGYLLLEKVSKGVLISKILCSLNGFNFKKKIRLISLKNAYLERRLLGIISSTAAPPDTASSDSELTTAYPQ